MSRDQSVAWVIAQTAETMAAKRNAKFRRAGEALRGCEILGFRRVSEQQREHGTQGLEVSLAFYAVSDRKAVLSVKSEIATRIARAFGLWLGAIQLNLTDLAADQNWLGSLRRSRRKRPDLRLDRYFTGELLEWLDKERHGLSDWKHLANHWAEVVILLRRLRYRLGNDYGSKDDSPNYAYWTTKATNQWAKLGGHKLDALVHKLSYCSDEMPSGGADIADSLDAGYWGDVDTEGDKLRVMQVTTPTGVSKDDVDAVLAYGGTQIENEDLSPVRKTTKKEREEDPILPFVETLTDLASDNDGWSEDVDVLLVHRGGGVEPRSNFGPGNASKQRRDELLDAATRIRDLGVEVVVAIGHADVSVLTCDGGESKPLPIGIFEATTPTAGAAWIVHEHVNPRLVDTSQSFAQR